MGTLRLYKYEKIWKSWNMEIIGFPLCHTFPSCHSLNFEVWHCRSRQSGHSPYLPYLANLFPVLTYGESIIIFILGMEGMEGMTEPLFIRVCWCHTLVFLLSKVWQVWQVWHGFVLKQNPLRIFPEGVSCLESGTVFKGTSLFGPFNLLVDQLFKVISAFLK